MTGRVSLVLVGWIVLILSFVGAAYAIGYERGMAAGTREHRARLP